MEMPARPGRGPACKEASVLGLEHAGAVRDGFQHLLQAPVQRLVLAQDEGQRAPQLRFERAHFEVLVLARAGHGHARQHGTAQARRDHGLDGLHAVELHHRRAQRAGALAQPFVHQRAGRGPGAELHHRLLAEHLRGHGVGPLAGAAAADGHEIVLQHRRRGDRAGVDGQGDEGDIDDVAFDLAHVVLRIAGAHDDLQRRIALAQVAQHRGKEVEAGREARAQAHRARHPGGMEGRRAHRVGHRGRDMRYLGEQVAAGGRGAHAPSHAFHQPHGQCALQLLDLDTDGGLGETQAFGRRRKTPQLEHQCEGAELL